MKNLSILFAAAAAVAAAVPGLAMILAGVGAPPGYKGVFLGVTEAFGALTIIILWMNRGRIKKTNKRKLTMIAVGLGIGAFVTLILQLLTFLTCVVTHPSRGTAYFPLWLTGDIADMVERAGSRLSAIEDYGIDGVKLKINEMAGFPIIATTLILLLLIVVLVITLTSAFGIAAIAEYKAPSPTDKKEVDKVE